MALHGAAGVFARFKAGGPGAGVGNEHFHERVKPQKGIYYFIAGAGGELRQRDVKNKSPLTEVAFAKDLHFILVEIADDALYFQVISRTGATIDSGVLTNRREENVAASK